jgi:hypothetical protein
MTVTLPADAEGIRASAPGLTLMGVAIVAPSSWQLAGVGCPVGDASTPLSETKTRRWFDERAHRLIRSRRENLPADESDRRLYRSRGHDMGIQIKRDDTHWDIIIVMSGGHHPASA